MALSGTRSLLMSLAPLLVGGGFSLRGLTYLPGFALGILVSMGGMGLLISEGFSRLGTRAGDVAYRVVTAFSAAPAGRSGPY